MILLLLGCAYEAPRAPPPTEAAHWFVPTAGAAEGVFTLKVEREASLGGDYVASITVTLAGGAVEVCSTVYDPDVMPVPDGWGAYGTYTVEGADIALHLPNRAPDCDRTQEYDFGADVVVPCTRGQLDGHDTLACVPEALYGADSGAMEIGPGAPLAYFARGALEMQRVIDTGQWRLTWIP